MNQSYSLITMAIHGIPFGPETVVLEENGIVGAVGMMNFFFPTGLPIHIFAVILLVTLCDVRDDNNRPARCVHVVRIVIDSGTSNIPTAVRAS